MTTGFPGARDNLRRPTATDNTFDPAFYLDEVLDDISDAIEKIQDYLGFQPINAQTGTNYTLVADDTLKLVTLNNSGAIMLSVPAGVFTTGQRIDVAVVGIGMATIIPGSGTPSVVCETGLALVSKAQYSVFSVFALSPSSFLVTGSLAAV